MNRAKSNTLKLLHIISGDLWAGAETMAFTLLSHLKAYPDIDLAVILLNEGRLAEELRSIGMTVQVIDEKKCSFQEIVRNTRTVLRAFTPDLIHSHRYKENILSAVACGFRGTTQLITTQHGLPELSGMKQSFANRLVSAANFQLMSHRFAKTAAVSGNVHSYLVQQRGFNAERVETIHNGVELPAAPQTKTGTGRCVIGSSGRLFPVKDYPFMVDIAKAVTDARGNNAYFELAGEGPERSAIEARILHCGLHGHFSMKGHQDDMDAFYQGLDLYLNTSVHEGIPMTILEALASGIPVIAPAVGGIGEIITNGVEGFLIEGRNPADFAEKCLLLQENRQLREKMSKAARSRVEQAFSAERMAEGYYKMYCERSTPWNSSLQHHFS